jgi:hypothetical protein
MRARSTTHRTTTAAVVVGLLLLVGPVACGDSGTTSKESSARSSTTTTTTLPTLSTSELQGALLTIADLPPGWSAETSTTTTTTAGSTGSAPSDFLCPAATAPLRKEQHDSAQATFTQGESGPFLLQSLASAPDADKHFTDITASFRSCIGQTWTMDDNGEKLDMTMAEISAPEVGDGSVAYRVSGTSSSMPLTMTIDFVIGRRGTVLEIYGGISIQSPLMATNQLSAEQFATIVATGDQKVAQALTP